MKGVVDYIDFWLRRDEWTFKEAAMLLNGVDPKYIKKIDFRPDALILNKLRNIEQIEEVVPTYLIFCSARWERYDIYAPSSESSYQDNYFRMAYDKDIKISPEILKRREEYLANIKSKKDLVAEVKSTRSMQESRELVLRGWLEGREYMVNQPLDLTRKEVWTELSKAVPEIFRPLSDETIKEFFKNQKFCRFKSGRRKGG